MLFISFYWNFTFKSTQIKWRSCVEEHNQTDIVTLSVNKFDQMFIVTIALHVSLLAHTMEGIFFTMHYTHIFLHDMQFPLRNRNQQQKWNFIELQLILKFELCDRYIDGKSLPMLRLVNILFIRFSVKFTWKYMFIWELLVGSLGFL